MVSIKERLEMIDPRAKSWHPDFIASVARAMAAKTYLEVGVYRGETIRKLSKVCERLIAIDIDPLAINSVKKIRNCEPFLGTLQDYVVSQSQISEFDLIFIDANHDIDAVLADFQVAVSLSSKNGLILLHDTWPKNMEFTSSALCGTAYLAPDRIRELYAGWNCVTLPVHPGLTICQRTSAYPDILE